MTWLMNLGCTSTASSLGKDLHVPGHISMTLIYGRSWTCFCISWRIFVRCFGKRWAGGRYGIQWTGLNLIFPCPSSCTTDCLLSDAHFSSHTLLWLIVFPTPDCFLPGPGNPNYYSRSSFSKLPQHPQLGEIPF